MLRNKSVTLVLSFVVVTVVTTAINCGCAFAATSPKHLQEAAVGHCEQPAEEKAKPESEECCLGCQLELGVFKTQDANLRFEQTKELWMPKAFLANRLTSSARFHLLANSQLPNFDTRSVSAPNSEVPLYLALESFLI